MKLKDLFEEQSNHAVPAITIKQAKDEKMVGPVYHGSSETGRQSIASQGFKVDDSLRVHGYPISNYAFNIPAPVHHLGYAIYFTTSKAIGKRFNNNSTKGLIQYYLNVPNLETINFAAHTTQMRWWQQNGYDFSWENIKGEKNFTNPQVEQERIRATQNMTKELASKYDAVWFKGKTLYKALDGDQICVYHPQDKIFRIDNSTINSIEVGAKVRCIPVEKVKEIYENELNQRLKAVDKEPVELHIYDRGAYWNVGWKDSPGIGLYVPKDPKNIGIIVDQHGNDQFGIKYAVKWKKGGLQYNYPPETLELVS